jgi:hypothetical protein
MHNVFSVPISEKQQSGSRFEGSTFLKLKAPVPSLISDISRKHIPFGILPRMMDCLSVFFSSIQSLNNFCSLTK